MKDELFRIREIFKDSGKSQTDIGKMISKTPQYIWKLLNNDNINPSDSVIKDICREFEINEQWLRNGIGEKKRKVSMEERYSLNLANLGKTDNETIIRWVNAIAETNPEVLKEIEKFMKKIIGIDEDTQGFECASLERTIDEELEIYRYELEAEEKKQGKSA